MNTPRHILQHKQTIGICFGIVAAIVILVSQTFYYDYLASGGIATELVDEDGNEEDILIMGKAAVTSAIHFTLTQTLHFISEVFLENTNKIEVEVDQKIEFNKYFRTLFRSIISPNAP